MCKEIVTSKGIKILVDDDDYEVLKDFKYHITYKGYACRSKWSPKKNIYIHREILGAKKGEQIDHINRDKLDNRKCNLRICSQSENSHNRQIMKHNSSGYKGVVWDKPNNKWKGIFTLNGKQVFCGRYVDPKEAYNAVVAKKIELGIKYF